jgi:ribosome-associated translation inhibitor RaiA
MTTFSNPTIENLEQNPEVKSFIYQEIAELEQYVTPQTVVAVVARDPRKLALQYETEGKEFDAKDLKKLSRISISLSESDTKIEAEGVADNVFDAIREAKTNLLKKLIAIHDSVVSQQDRLIEINHYLQNPVLH